MGIINNLMDNLAGRFWDSVNKQKDAFSVAHQYFVGNQKKQLKVPWNKTDDNIIQNVVGLVIDRSVSHVLAGGVQFDLPDKVTTEGGKEVKEATEQQIYIDDVWEVNKKDNLLLNTEIKASVYGTFYIKISPDEMVDPYTGNVYPRLISLNPEYLTINVDPQDQERVLSYVIEYQIGEVKYRFTTRRVGPDDKTIDGKGKESPLDETHWLIIDEIQEGGPWQIVNKVEWPYEFPNIVHGKNLPSLDSIYGTSDIDNIIGMQDKINATVSYIQKQVRLQQHKQLVSHGVGDADKLDVGPDRIINLRSPDAGIDAVNLQTDIAGSMLFAKDLRQSTFNIAREIDITSMADKLGALTNFGLRVLYTDSLGKCDTKRMLLAEALCELNRRLLVMNGWEGELSRPGDVKWQDPLPVNLKEKYEAQSVELSNNTVDHQTIAEENGRDWKQVSARLAEEQAKNDNGVGAAILRAFPPQ